MMFSALRRTAGIAAVAMLCVATVRGQQPAPAPTATTPAAAAEATAPAAPAPPDPKVVKSWETLLNQKFSRDPNEIFQSLEKSGLGDISSLNPAERFVHFFRTSDWAKIRSEL